MNNEPRKPVPVSRRDQLEARRTNARSLMLDDEANVGANVAIGIVIAIIVAFFGRIIVLKQNAKADAVCEDLYADDATAEAGCKSDNSDFVTFGGLALLVALLVGGGLYVRSKQTG